MELKEAVSLEMMGHISASTSKAPGVKKIIPRGGKGTFRLQDASLTQPPAQHRPNHGPQQSPAAQCVPPGEQRGINREVPQGPSLPPTVISARDDFSINNIVSPSSREFIIAPLQCKPPRTNYLSIGQSCRDTRLPVADAAEAQAPRRRPSPGAAAPLTPRISWTSPAGQLPPGCAPHLLEGEAGPGSAPCPLLAAGAPGRGKGFRSTPIPAGSDDMLQHPPPPAPAATQGDAEATLLWGKGKKYPERDVFLSSRASSKAALEANLAWALGRRAGLSSPSTEKRGRQPKRNPAKILCSLAWLKTPREGARGGGARH